MESLIKFSGTVVITGTSSGIGRGLCKSFVERGYNVFGTVRNKKDALELEKEFGQNFNALIMDVTNEKQILLAKEKVKNYLGNNLPHIDKENRDFHFLTHDFMRSRYIEINHELMSLITKLKNDHFNDKDIIEEIKSLIKSHERKFPNRYKHQNTYSDKFSNFKLF